MGYYYYYGSYPSSKTRLRRLYAFLILIVVIFLTINFFSDIILKSTTERSLLYSSGLLISLLALVKPELPLFIVFFSTPIYNPYLHQEFGRGARLSIVILIFTFIITFFKKIIIENKPMRITLNDFFILSFIAVIVFSTSESHHFVDAKRRIQEFLLLFIGYYVSIITFQKEKLLRTFFTIFFISSFIGGLYGIYTKFYLPFYGKVDRAYGAFMNPNSLGLYLTYILPFNITFLSYKIPQLSKRKRKFLILNLIILLLTLFFTKSRTSWAGFLIASGFLFIKSRNKAILILLMTIFVTTIFIVPEFYNRISPLVNLNDSALQARFFLWEKAWEHFNNNLVTGIGIGNYWEHPVPYNAKWFDIAFNIYLTIGAELGLLGLLLFLGMIFSTLAYFYDNIHKVKNPFLLAVAYGSTAIFIGNLFQGLFEDTILAIFTNWIFGIVWGLIFVSIHLGKKQAREAKRNAEFEKTITTNSAT